MHSLIRLFINNEKGIQRKKSKKYLHIYDFTTESWDYEKSISKSDPILFDDIVSIRKIVHFESGRKIFLYSGEMY